MEDINSIILPRVLETLSRKPNLSDTIDNLCHDMQEFLAKENSGVIPSMGSIRKSLKKALNVGQGLGIITMTEEVIRVPFSFRRDGNGIRAPVTTVANVQNEEENDDDFMEYEEEDQSSSRRKSGQPKKRNNSSNDGSEFFMMTPRRHYDSTKSPTDRDGRRRSAVRRRRPRVGMAPTRRLGRRRRRRVSRRRV